ncbi:mucin-5AC-like [Oppia nitens]|uniref:mucin-5AC-like n=1 Tax=Oppia nitens TaxID=1686743 RepID=UPI0023DCBBE9|nr:mucin-5AC-like [Oppia nitens]
MIFLFTTFQSLNISDIDSHVLLHNRVKNTLVEIAINGRCDLPKPTVVYVNDTNNKIYLPRATILYRCSDLFACCPNPRQTCRASEEQEVDIGFYTLVKTDDGITERHIETIRFSNHTKCQCRRRDDLQTSGSTIRHENINGKYPHKEVTTKQLNDSKGHNKTMFIEMHMKKTNNYTTSFISSTTTTRSLTPKIVSKTTTIPHISISSKKQTITSIQYTPTTQRPSLRITKLLSTSTSSKTLSTTTSTHINPTVIGGKTIEKFQNSYTSAPTRKLHTIGIIFNTTVPTTQTISSTTIRSTLKMTKTTEPHKSTINYGELEREEDLNPEEDVTSYSKPGHGFDIFFTNDVFFRSYTSTTPMPSPYNRPLVTKRCNRH